MNPRVSVFRGERSFRLNQLDLMQLDELAGVSDAGLSAAEESAAAVLTADSPWEVELGFGKGRYLLRAAAENPGRRFLGIEIAGKYCRMAASRSKRRGLRNLVLIHGEARYLLSSCLPRGFAEKVHIYFPDPWPKTKHHKRRLMDPESVDLVLSLLKPGGELLFASDFIAYGELVEVLLRGHPRLQVERREELWPDGARTNYEAKFLEEGRPIIRLIARLAPVVANGAPSDSDGILHPAGRLGVVSAHTPYEDPAEGLEVE